MIYVGTAGYSYQDWIGPVYPEGTKKGEMLEYYAREFMFTEVNSTYYSMPNKYMMWNLAQKTPEEFRFVVKAHRSMTHERSASKEDYDRFMESLQPLAESDKLGGILVQFPYSFHCSKSNIEYVKWLAGCLEGVPAAVEFRNERWINETTFEALRRAEIGYVCVDEPDIKGLVKPVTILTSGIGYVRFHGRNEVKWYNHKESFERYNYLYSEEELSEWVPRIKQLAAKAERVFVSLNNHYQGQAVRNARMVREMLKS
ncbi:MAG: DUF72 domain-containing protein [Firmicutes bacterium HGW-Firmicutes-14]|jgi:uncharacterized protein YecE (DUF72 family)|nr:MAG: DUF72 domain-containing protein [Firmicutes bacterium HGW-Firmicutes-14]